MSLIHTEIVSGARVVAQLSPATDETASVLMVCPAWVRVVPDATHLLQNGWTVNRYLKDFSCTAILDVNCSDMKSKIAGEEAAKSSEYPVLKKTSVPLCGWEYVVLFSAPRTGMIVHIIKQGDADAPPRIFKCEVGNYSDGFGEDSFEKYNGIIELSN